jgi:polyhydroxyalkanoate synthesis repressor PhaR
MTEPRTIKKYPNRRLYDTEESRYITLSDIRRLVVEDLPFTVIDQKSGEDITRSILLQVISEEETQRRADHDPGFPLRDDPRLQSQRAGFHRQLS